jgi:serine/threonine-protein kinase
MMHTAPQASGSRRWTWPRVTARRVVLLIAVLASLLAFTPLNAKADANGVTILRNWQTGMCLDDNGGTVFEAQCNSNPSQNWLIFWPGGTDSAGHYVIKISNKLTNTCLTTENESTSAGGGDPLPVWTAACDQSPGQWWVWYGDPTVGQYHNQANDACLDNNGSAVYAQACNGGGFQDWRQGY